MVGLGGLRLPLCLFINEIHTQTHKHNSPLTVSQLPSLLHTVSFNWLTVSSSGSTRKLTPAPSQMSSFDESKLKKSAAQKSQINLF